MANAQFSEKEIKQMKAKLYQECYHGHLPDSFWRKLAIFVLEEANSSFSAGSDWGSDTNWS